MAKAVAPTIVRPPSELAKLAARVRKAAPSGLPGPVQKFYAAGDGLTVTTRDGEATIVGLKDMFDGAFKPHRPVTKPIDKLDGRPFADRFFDDDFDFSEDGALERFNLLLRLKLLVSVAGESMDIAVDLFAGKEPVLYTVYRGSTVLRLDLSFDDFVAWFSKFGTARWYFAFLELDADEARNIDVAAEFEASMRDFEPRDVAPMRKQLAARTKALAKHRTALAAKQKKADAEAAKPASISGAALAEIKKECADTKYGLLILSEPNALVGGIQAKKLPPETAWNYSEGIRSLPATLLPAVLVAPRKRTQDNFWARVDQLVGVTVPEKVNVDSLLQDVLSVHAVLRGEKTKLSARVTKALATWLDSPPRDAAVAGTAEAPTTKGFKRDIDYQRARARYHRDRLLAIGTALVGEKPLRTLLAEAYKKAVYGND